MTDRPAHHTVPVISPPASPAPARPFTVLTVCTGNICRSPAVERLLVARLGPDADVRVVSAGTRALVGHPVSGPMVPLMVAADASADGFAARQLTAEMIREADLVLPLTRQHRSAVVELVPAAVRRTFTLLELARLAGTVDPDAIPGGSPAQRLTALVPLLAGERARHHHRPGFDDDVPDPYGRGDAVYARVFAAIEPAVDAVARLARG